MLLIFKQNACLIKWLLFIRIDNILSDSTTKPGHAIKLYKNLQSVSRTPQSQKNTNTALNEPTASMYVAKPNMPSLHNSGFTSDSINKMNLASKLHFSGSQSSLINSGMWDKMDLIDDKKTYLSNFIQMMKMTTRKLRMVVFMTQIVVAKRSVAFPIQPLSRSVEMLSK